MAYGSDVGLASYLALTGRTLPTGVVPAVAREWGSQYVNLWEDRYKSTAINPPDSFPRHEFDPIPAAVEYAAYEAAIAWADGVSLFGSGGTAGGQVIRKKVDVMEIAYAEPQAGSGGWWDNNRFIWPLAYNYLLPYMKRGLGGASAFVVGPC